MDDQVLPDQASVCIKLSPYSPRVGPGSIRTSSSSSSSSYSPSSSSSYSTSSSSCSSIAAAAAAHAAAGSFESGKAPESQSAVKQRTITALSS